MFHSWVILKTANVGQNILVKYMDLRTVDLMRDYGMFECR